MTMMVCALKHIWNLSYWEKVVFQSIVGIEIFTNFFLNALIVFLIFKTKQYEKQSFKLLMVVSLSNCFTAIFGQGSFFLAFFDMFGDLPCVVQSLCQGLITWTCTFCFSVNFLVGLDRYLHIRYPVNYINIFSNKRFTFASSMILPVSLIALGLNYLSFYLGYRYPVFTIPFTFGVVSFTFGLQIKSVFLLKKHLSTRKNVTSTSKKITKLTIKYLFLFLIFVVGGKLLKDICSTLLRRYIDKATINFMMTLSSLYKFLHYPAVAITFLAHDIKSQKFIKKKLSRRFKDN